MNKIENETHHRQMRNELLLVVIPRPMNSPSVKQTAILTPIFQRVRFKHFPPNQVSNWFKNNLETELRNEINFETR